MTVSTRLGGHVLVDQLIINHSNIAFGVPGESFLAVLDGFYQREKDIRFIVCRQEGGAANMAEAYGKLTGRPGLCFVTRGPGACNASIGVHTAHQDSTPMILFIGQVGSDFVDREAFQEVDYRKMFAPLCKWVAQIDRADRIPEYISHAYHVAMSSRPGPVVLALPEDMLTTAVNTADAPAAQRVLSYPGETQCAQVAQMLRAAQRPIVILGGSGWDAQACAHAQRFIEAWQLPTGCAFRFQDLLDNNHPNYVGDVGIGINPKLAARVREADLVLAIGPRLGEMTTGGYTLLQSPRPTQKLIHVHAGAEELGRVYQADLAINATPSVFAQKMADLAAPTSIPWQARTRQARSEYEANATIHRRAGDTDADLSEMVGVLKAKLPRNAIITNGAGNYSAWLHRYYPYGGFRTQLAPTSGAMGYGVPAAVAAKILYPERVVVSWNGDGCFLMNGQELATAMQYDAHVIFVVVNNGTYGTIRMHQEREYPARVSGTDLKNPNFALLAQAHGAQGVQVRTLAEFEAAFTKALTNHCASLIEVIVDAEYISPRATITDLRKR
jgi:acetolactate synthase I/II/III large subunit